MINFTPEEKRIISQSLETLFGIIANYDEQTNDFINLYTN